MPVNMWFSAFCLGYGIDLDNKFRQCGVVVIKIELNILYGLTKQPTRSPSGFSTGHVTRGTMRVPRECFFRSVAQTYR